MAHHRAPRTRTHEPPHAALGCRICMNDTQKSWLESKRTTDSVRNLGWYTRKPPVFQRPRKSEWPA
eukprot:6336661-Pyramimonas_sp.AAC.1